MPEAVKASQKGKVAIVFGNEPNGLNNEQVGACTHLLEIPTSDLYDSMNLATAVGICLYELRWPGWMPSEPGWPGSNGIPRGSKSVLFSAEASPGIDRVSLWGKVQTLFEGIKHLLMRCHPELKDLKLLHGLARQILWFVANHEPKKGKKPLESPSSQGPGAKELGDFLEDSD